MVSVANSFSMLRSLLVVCLVGAGAATPTRSREDVEKYRNFLMKSSLDQFKDAVPSPLHPEMYSGKFEGDIVLDSDEIEAMVAQYASGRNAVIFPGFSTQWPDNTVIYSIVNTHFEEPGQREALFDAMRLIESKTCVQFREADLNVDRTFVNMTSYPERGCYAHVGYRIWRGPHMFNLGSDCFLQPTITHELMHILGFIHMHNTYDRDEYVKIQMENVARGAEFNFDKWNHYQVGNLGVEYDYFSCLQMPESAWSSNSQPTIVPLKEIDGVMGQRDHVTDKDWLRINRYHDCPGAWE